MTNIQNITFDSSKFDEISQSILKQAKEKGASQAEVVVAANKGFSVGARGGDVETVEYHQDKSIDIKVYFGKRAGASSLSDMQPNAIKDAVEAACHIAKFTDEDPDSGLADKSEMAFNYPKLDLSFPWPISVERAIEIAISCEKEALAFDKRIMSAEEVSVSTGEGYFMYANSLGFIGHFPHSRHEISCILIGKDGEEMQRDYSYTVAVSPKHLEHPEKVARDAAERTVKRLGARKLPTMKTPVIFIAEEARSLFGSFVSAISGGSLYRKSSFLIDHLDKKIFPDFMHIQEFPFLPEALGSSPFDGDGVATRENVFIENGILRNYVLGVYSARKLGMKTTGDSGGVHNLVVRSGNKNFSELLKTMGRGLVVTETMGNGINLVTGDYSRGVGGYWVENGEIQYPVHEITIAGRLQDMYAGIVEVGSDVDVRGNIRTGSVLINEMMVAGE